MSLAAIPVFLLARRLRVGDRLALAAAAVAVVLPELVYSSSVLAESLAYPLALTAVAVAVAVIERPLLRLQLAVSRLLRPGRLQPPAAGGPAPLLPARDRRGRPPRATVAHEAPGAWLAVGATVAFLAGGLGVGLVGSLGIYGSLTAYSVEPVGAAKAIGANASVLGYAAGWVMVPGALLGLALALARPRGRGEFAFGVLALSLLVSLLIQAALVGDVGRVQERYVIYARAALSPASLPSTPSGAGRTSACTHSSLRSPPRLPPSCRWPATPQAGAPASRSSWSRCRSWSGSSVTSVWRHSCSPRQRRSPRRSFSSQPPCGLRFGTMAALAVTAAVGVGMTAAADIHYKSNRAAVRAVYLPADPSWVDAAGSGPVTLLAAPHSARADLLTTLFWNRSVQRVVLLDGAGQPDPFAAPSADLDDAGHLVGTTGLVLADAHGSSLVLRNAVRVAAGPTKTLWRSSGAPQLEVMMAGRYYSGLLSRAKA